MSEQHITDIPSQVERLISTAISQSASDIHLECVATGLRVRFRIDGMLQHHTVLPSSSAAQVISRIKVLAHINIAQKRVPQDGKFCTTFAGRVIDLRVSTFPTIAGEKVVIRILDRERNRIQLDELGFSPQMLNHFRFLITRSSGFILVTGPTGSGKTTTLYAALSELYSPQKNIITLEDPVEYQLDGVTQGYVQSESGFTYDNGIRAMLRQDPDVIMIGEMRDPHTTQVAISAALTGHLVLTTLHTHDAAGSIMRLMDMGIEPFLINAAITGVLAQRLARKICHHCKVAYMPTVAELPMLEKLGLMDHEIYMGKGCSQCLSLGYKGRVGVFELLVMTNELRSKIVKQPVYETMYKQAIADGMQTLVADGVQKVKQGIISVQELMRILM